MKEYAGILFGFLVLSVLISGCTDNTQNTYGTQFYEGKWKVGTDHFGGIPQQVIDAFSGNYKAYQNNTTITLVGTGKQMSLQNDTNHQIKVIFTQDGSNVNTTYYLDGSLKGYSYTKDVTIEQLFNNSKKIWEGSRTTAEEQFSSELVSRTENVKL
ncbi:hypothetical protein [Methanobacterium formicicum]|uniref:Uncharacterized protein n=1 Tax=Methanobacterium formicicum TaxID=2162 RepID=A0A843AMD4_METFO|nr:hypothetical protein [Methanobacterium formicicum]MBF4474551.1 hypothetical protein [Methanobacterium formicicum]